MRRTNILSYMTYAERQAYRESRKGEIAAAKAKKSAKAMTCQCCGRQIFAQAGSIAHHGYERPGYGWQTASCMGAKYPPLQVDRARLADLIVALKQMIVDAEADRAKIVAEKVKLPFTVTIDCDPYLDARGKRWLFSKADDRFYSRKDWDAAVAAGEASYEGGYVSPIERTVTLPNGEVRKVWPEKTVERQISSANGYRDYDKMKDGAIAQVDSTLRHLTGDLKIATDRYASWKQTHTHFDRQSKVWVEASK